MIVLPGVGAAIWSTVRCQLDRTANADAAAINGDRGHRLDRDRSLTCRCAAIRQINRYGVNRVLTWRDIDRIAHDRGATVIVLPGVGTAIWSTVRCQLDRT